MFCSICGTKNDDGAKFCSACGAPLAAGADDAATRLIDAAPVSWPQAAGPAPQQGGQPPASQPGQQPASWQAQPGQPSASWPSQPGQPPASWSAQPGQPSASWPSQPDQPPASWSAQPGQPPAPGKPKRRRTGIIIGAVAGVVALAAVVVGVLLATGVIPSPFSIDSEPVSSDSEQVSSTIEAVSMPDYMNLGYYVDLSPESVCEALEDEGLVLDSVRGVEYGWVDVNFNGRTDELLPYGSDDGDVTLSVEFNGGSADLSTVDAVEEIPVDARIDSVLITYDAAIEKTNYVTATRMVIEYLGLSEVSRIQASSQELLDEAIDEYGVDPDDCTVNSGAEAVDLSVYGIGFPDGTYGVWFVEVTNNGTGNSISLFYINHSE